ncbi:hypothetical protein MQE36_16130 [Zhouia spongiae]|uniref:Uncharacterized protein n=1 Tax=Zhouia spongiae TaxID=2202721 RepID=A0ABY3YL78_9FLAO|nr:hypothetical protein [Zhouia spongiae]UNY98595.1 hypothetical protein MQE36_16130 [Zhouia spongiae]
MKLISHKLIVCRDYPTVDEPFEGFKISETGILSILFRLWYSAGSWDTTTYAYKFRFRQNEFVLIGLDLFKTHRGNGNTTDYSINFLTSKMKISKGLISESKPKSVEWKTFNLKTPVTLKSIENPLAFNPEEFY